MRLLLRTKQRTWPVEPGLTLVGSSPDCHVLLDDAPPYAAAIVRWFRQNMLYPIGDPPELRINGQLFTSYALRDGDILTLGGLELWVAFRPRADGDTGLPAAAELGKRVLRAANAAREYAAAKEEKQREQKLLKVVSSVTGAKRASFSPDQDGTAPRLVRYRDDSSPVDLEWGKKGPPDRDHTDHRLISLGTALDDFALWEATDTTAVVPHREHTLRIRQQDSRIGAYGVLGWSDLSHLDRPRSEIREPLMLVTTFGERLELVDLTASGALKLNGKERAHLRPSLCDGKLTVLDHDLEIFEHPPVEALLSMPLQLSLGAPDDPLSGAVALGCLLSRLKTREERAEAVLLAATSMTQSHSGAIVWTGSETRSIVTTLLELSRHQSSSWMRSSGIPSPHLDRLVKRAIKEGKPVATEDLLADGSLATGYLNPGDPVAAIGSALAIPLEPKGACLLLSRGRGVHAYTTAQRRVAVDLSGLFEPMPASSAPPARLPERPVPSGERPLCWLQVGALRVPLVSDGCLIIGRDEQADLRITGDGTISRQHTLLVTSSGRHPQVVDLRSSNGTFVEGALVEQSPLKPGQQLKVGELELTYELDRQRSRPVAEFDFLPLDQPLKTMAPEALGCLSAATEEEALKLTLPALAAVTDADEARWVTDNLFAGGGPAGGAFLVPSALGTGGWIALEKTGGPQPRDRHRIVLRAQVDEESHLVDRPIWIGRGFECDIRVDHAAVSRRHALLVPTESGCEIVDIRSSAGVRLNGSRVGRADVSAGDILEVGPVVLLFSEQGLEEEGQGDAIQDAKRLLRVLGECRARPDDVLEQLASAILRRTDAGSIVVLAPGKAGPVLKLGEPLPEAGVLKQLEPLVRSVLRDSSPRVKDLSEVNLYRLRQVTLQLPDPELRSAIGFCLLTQPTMVAVAFSKRMPLIAFDHAAARWVEALTSMLT